LSKDASGLSLRGARSVAGVFCVSWFMLRACASTCGLIGCVRCARRGG
jgi:hypothetical protein